MIKLLRIPVTLTVILFFFTSSFAQFPYFESFKEATAPGIVFGGAPSAFLTAAGSSSLGGTPIDPLGDGYLRLTNNTTNQKGYVYSDQNFPSSYGLAVQFEYYTYGGSGADGICFFLFDATANPFNIGGFGGSLGYAQYRQTSTSPVSPGISKGYLGVGLDEFGNFSNPTEGRQGGNLYGPRPGSVTLRGKGDGDDLVTSNYTFLTTTRTQDLGFTLVGNSSSRRPDSTSTGYRRVYLDLEPNPGGGYNITVKITCGGTPTTTFTVINNYYYNVAAPQLLRYGISSSTGAQTNNHEIRNVFIDVFDKNPLIAPTATNDNLTVCEGHLAKINVLDNDVSNNPGGSIIKESIDLDPTQIGVQNSFEITGKGNFVLNSDGSIEFLPLSSTFIGTVSMQYTIKDTYGQLSNPATVTVNYTEPPISPFAGNDKLINITVPLGSFTLEADNPSGGSGTWSQVSGPNTAAFANASIHNTTVSNLTGGDYVFRWSVVSAGGCEIFDDVKISVNHRPIAANDEITTNLNTDISIPILNNDTDEEGNTTLNPASIKIISLPLFGTVIIDPVTGKVNYKPNNGYSGYDSFVYTVEDNYSVESNQAIVTIAVNIKPKGINDDWSTYINTAVVIPVTDNDPDRIGAIVIKNSDPQHGTISISNDVNVTYSPSIDFSGKDVFTYKLKNNEGLESDVITVTIMVKPAGSADHANTPANQSVTIPVKNNDVGKNGTSVVIATPPNRGVATLNAAGEVVYVPDITYAGTDNFTYKLVTADGVESDPISVNIIVTATQLAPAKIGLAKGVTSLSTNPDGTFNLTYLFTIVNYGEITIDNISLIDNLGLTFQDASYTIKKLTATGSLVINPSFNGSLDQEMLLPSSTIKPVFKEHVELELLVNLGNREGLFYNSAYTEGLSTGDGSRTTDVSTNGLSPDPSIIGNVSPEEKTPVTLIKQKVFIPEGFSPNNDGINDFFIIQNTLGKQVSLEIFNRWGNRIYKSSDYKNEWNGVCTEGVHIGQDVPVGTYYYIVIIDNEKKAGYITINR